MAGLEKDPSVFVGDQEQEQQPLLGHCDVEKAATFQSDAAAAAAAPSSAEQQNSRKRGNTFRRWAWLGSFAAACWILSQGCDSFRSLRKTHDESSVRGYLHAFLSDKGLGHHRHHSGPQEHDYGYYHDLYLGIPNNESAMAASRSYTGFEHTSGRANDLKVAQLVKKQWEELLHLPVSGDKKMVFDAGSKDSKRMLLKEDGPRVWIDTYYVLLNHPTPLKESETSITLSDGEGKLVHKAKLAEDALPQDKTSTHGNEAVPPFHGYSKRGGAEGQLIYAHFGLKEDFDRLKAAGVDVRGKIAMVRYGGNFRGLKVKAAEDAGAVGVIIYSDPGEDGEITVDQGHLPYPAGPARQPSSLQRGSVQYLSYFPGDPTTPDVPSYKGVKRVEPTNLPSIPSLPLSYEDAIPLLRSLNGRGPCFEDWIGGLDYENVSYCSGESEGLLKMFNDINEEVQPIWNTYAVVPGHIQDEVVLVGNHRDAWVFGAADPNSGTASVHEIVKAFGQMMEKGWKPLRTIVFASWDAEEYGLVGSTEFGEDYAKWSKKIVAYLNVDVSVSGSGLSIHASPSLADMLRDCANIGAPPEKPTNETLPIGPLGSGSDYTVFLQHLGVPSSDMGYKGKTTDPVYHYHSIYDSEDWMERYGDPGFHRHVNVAKALGLATLRLSDSLVTPLNITAYAVELGAYLKELKDTAAGLDFTSINFDKTDSLIMRIQSSAADLDEQAKSALDNLAALETASGCPRRRAHQAKKELAKIRVINARRSAFERGFINEKGLPKRPWYKHLGVAPGINLGYGSTTFPGVTEAMAVGGDEESAKQELRRLNKQLKTILKSLRSSKHDHHHRH